MRAAGDAAKPVELMQEDESEPVELQQQPPPNYQFTPLQTVPTYQARHLKKKNPGHACACVPAYLCM
jgi:hypothetical protein